VEILTSFMYHPCGVTHLLQVSARVPTTWKCLFHVPPAWSRLPLPGISQSTNHVEMPLLRTTQGVTHLLQVSARVPTTWKCLFYVPPKESLTSSRYQPEYQPRLSLFSTANTSSIFIHDYIIFFVSVKYK
jgi:hypothetical protein